MLKGKEIDFVTHFSCFKYEFDVLIEVFIITEKSNLIFMLYSYLCIWCILADVLRI